LHLAQVQVYALRHKRSGLLDQRSYSPTIFLTNPNTSPGSA